MSMQGIGWNLRSSRRGPCISTGENRFVFWISEAVPAISSSFASSLGHSVMGLDLDWPPMYAEMFEMMEMPRRVWRIEPFQPLPDLGGRFDFLTGFAVCFNSHGSDHVWGAKEWEFFLDDVEKNVLSDFRRNLFRA